MTWTKENMFEPSGCLTREAFEALVNHQLPAEARALADEHVVLCPFCSDALEGFSSQKEEFAVLMDKTDDGYAVMVAKTQSKASNRRLWLISVSAAASVLMLVGLFIFLNQPQPKMQVAQSTPKTEHQDKSEPERLIISENSVKEKQPVPETKTKPSKSAIHYTPPEVSKGENKSRADELAVLPKTAAPEAAQDTYEERPVLADAVIEDKKDKGSYKEEAEKSMASGMTTSKRMAGSSAVRKVSADEAEMPLAFAEQMPQFPGGTDAMMKFISSSLVYPKTAAEMGISGKVMLQFEVDRKGKIKNIRVIRGIGGGCDEEAVRVVGLMPRWNPGKQNGTAVSVYFTLPIQFSLQK